VPAEAAEGVAGVLLGAGEDDLSLFTSRTSPSGRLMRMAEDCLGWREMLGPEVEAVEGFPCDICGDDTTMGWPAELWGFSDVDGVRDMADGPGYW
jgi:hypothetical protein